jgi:hypothetical protein
MRGGRCLLRAFSGFVLLGTAGAIGGGLTGCAVTPSLLLSCTSKLIVLPAAATADHTLAAPGNQIAFNVGFIESNPACAMPQVIPGPQTYTWVSSDSYNAPIGNVAATAGVVICEGATTATISVNSVAGVQTATLTCK